MLRKPLRLNRRRRDDDFQIRPLDCELLHVAQQKIDVEAAFVCFVDDQRVVFPQPAIAMRFSKQYSVGHHFHKGTVIGVIVETNLVTDRMRAGLLQLMRQPCGQRACGDPARLGAADHAVNTAPEFKAYFRQLGGLARAGFAAEDNDLIFLDECSDFGAALGNGQRIVERRVGKDIVALLSR